MSTLRPISGSGLALLGFILGVIVLWVLAPLVLLSWLELGKEASGQIGDLFGSVNALFSGLAFAVLIWTVLQQREQLALQGRQLAMQGEQLDMQRQELKLQREEMAASRTELANQAKAQHHLAQATVAQIGVAAAQAHIEAAKLEGSRYTAGAHRFDELVREIRGRADALALLADQLVGDMRRRGDSS